MRRRDLFGLAGAMTAWSLGAGAQAPLPPRRIGVLSQGSRAAHPTPLFRSFLAGLREAGWEEGRTLDIAWRFSEGSAAPLDQLARELVALPVELLVTSPTEPTLAAKRATATIPIVFVPVADPVQSGIVASLSRPEANLTGMSAITVDIAAKRLALIQEVLPDARRIAVLWNRPSKGAALVLNELVAVARQRGIVVLDHGIDGGDQLEAALRGAADDAAALVVVIEDTVMQDHAERAARLAAALRLPMVSQTDLYVRAGGLMAYGPDFDALFRRGAEYVDRILRGARPADLPVQQPETFRLVLNLRTARALGLTISPLVLARADELID